MQPSWPPWAPRGGGAYGEECEYHKDNLKMAGTHTHADLGHIKRAPPHVQT